jgi:diguanylate cyclase (GGDEF)-like protein
VLSGTCADVSVLLAPLREAVDRYLEHIDRLAEPARSTAREHVRAAAADTGGLVGGLSPALAGLLGRSTPERGEQDQFCEAVARLLTGLASIEGGAVLHLDDIHRADPLTLQVLRHLAPRLSQAPLLMVLTGRDAGLVDIFPADLHLMLGPLDRAATAVMIRTELGANEVPVRLIDKVVTRSGGNPLAVGECLRAVLDGGLLRPSWGAWLLDETRLDALTLPDDIMDLVLSRMRRLTDHDRDLLRLAAVVGISFGADVLAAAGDLPEPAVLASLNAAATAGVVEVGDDGNYGFVHEELRQSLLASIDQAVRRTMHQRVGEALRPRAGSEPDRIYQVAAQYLAGEWQVAPQDTMRAAADAGGLALTRWAPVTALQLLTSAELVAQAHQLPVTVGLLTDIGVAAMRADQYEIAHAYLDRALAAEPEQLRRATLFMRKAETYHLRWLGEPALDSVRDAYAEIGRPVPRHPALLALTTAGLVLNGFLIGTVPLPWREVRGPRRRFYKLYSELSNVGAKSAAMTMDQPLMGMLDLRALPAANRLGPGPELVAKKGGLAILAGAFGWRTRADRTLAAAFRMAAGMGDPVLTAQLHWMAGIAHDNLPERDATHGGKMRVAIEEHGQWLEHSEFASGVAILGHHALLRGHADQAEHWYQRGAARMSSQEEITGSVIATLAAQAAALRGQPGPATSLLSVIEEQLAGTPQRLAARLLLAIARVHLAVELGELDELGSAYEQAMAQLTALRISPRMAWSYHRNLWLYHAFGRLEHAVEAPPEHREERLAAATAAVGMLRKAAKGLSLRSFHAVAAASLRQLRGDHRGALRRLGPPRDEAAGLDNPLLDYEVFTVRARANRALGNETGARRDAAIAAAIATENGWALRALRIRTTFGLQAQEQSIKRTNRTYRRATGSVDTMHQRRLEALHDVSVAAASVLDPLELTRITLDETVRIFGAERAFLFLTDPDTDALVPYLGRDAQRQDLVELTGYSTTLVERAHQSGEPLVVTGSDEGLALGSQSAMVHGLRSIMVTPLHVKGRLHGVVYLDSRVVKGVFTDDDVELLAAISNHIALSMETARATQLELAVRTAKRDRDLAQLLHAAMTDIGGSLDPDEVALRSVTTVRRVLDAATAILLRKSADDMVAVARAGAGAEPETTREDDPELAALLDHPPTGHFGRAEAEALPAALGDGVTSWLAVQVRLRGEQLGLLLAGIGPGRDFTPAEVELANVLAGYSATALENALLFRRVGDLATQDGLTGLFNRRHFFDLAHTHVEAAHRSGRPLAALMLDIDHFKNINDTYGHGVGDEVIREVGRRLAMVLRTSDILCRYGGEEFAVLLAETSTRKQAYGAARRLHDAVTAEPIATASGPLAVTVSGGLAGPAEASSLEILLKQADEALYVAKRNGRDQVSTFGG